MKKILLIIPTLIVVGLALLSPISLSEEETKQEASSQLFQAVDPGTGW